jgi:hypothetical protein
MNSWEMLSESIGYHSILDSRIFAMESVYIAHNYMHTVQTTGFSAGISPTISSTKATPLIIP